MSEHPGPTKPAAGPVKSGRTRHAESISAVQQSRLVTSRRAIFEQAGAPPSQLALSVHASSAAAVAAASDFAASPVDRAAKLRARRDSERIQARAAFIDRASAAAGLEETPQQQAEVAAAPTAAPTAAPDAPATAYQWLLVTVLFLPRAP